MSVTNDCIEANEAADREETEYIADTQESLKVLLEGFLAQEVDPKNWMRPKKSRGDFIEDIIQPILLDYIIETKKH